MAIEFEVKIPARHWYSSSEAITSRAEFTSSIKNWLEDNIGEEETDWSWVIFFPYDGLIKTYDKFRFKHEEDKVKFILRWL